MPFCQHCASHVSEAFSEVFGLGGDVRRCIHCDSGKRLKKGSAAGVDLAEDPEQAPGRHGDRTDAAIDRREFERRTSAD